MASHHKLVVWFFALLSFSIVVSCGNDTKKRAKLSNNSSNNTSNNTTNNSTTSGTNNDTNNIDPTKCGNGDLDPGEACDPLIDSGDGACPTSCEDAPACFTAVLTGDAATCTARCEAGPVGCSATSDSCCSLGCDSESDPDCTNSCGNGVVEAGESCDGDCPTSCDDSNACTTDTFTGSADKCSFQCTNTSRTTCVGGDGCCPAGCTSATDNDCSTTCGNGMVDAGEVCDGNCPTACNDNNACTKDTLTGAAATCSAQCSSSNITSCQGGDGCCPVGCTAAVDSDCTCNPTTSCAAQGLTCGSIFNGCANVSCGNCGNGETCQNNVCTLSLSVGTPCTSDANCTGSQCLTAAETGWGGGYCTLTCTQDSQCGSGNHCGYKDPENNNQGVCLKNCTTDASCGRTGYGCSDRDGQGVKECTPSGSGSTIGSPCTTIQQCPGGNNAACFRQNSAWYQGYCTRTCQNNTDCGAGAHCGLDGLCLANTCNRMGYQVYDADADGTLECFTAATGTGAVGAACVGSWQCAGGQNGGCFSDATGLPGGYCTLFCGAGEATCSGDSACYNNGDFEFCVDGCTSASQCRTGYSCTDVIGNGQNSCWL